MTSNFPYKVLTVVNGILIAVMLLVNGILAKIVGPYIGTLIFHLIALITLLILKPFVQNAPQAKKPMKLLYLFPGISSVLTVLLNAVSVANIGVTLTGGIGLFGQLFMSSLVDHFGLFGMKKRPIDSRKWLGYALISLGVIIMICY